ncbi:phosphatase PAP2 family protein [Pseudomonas sp. SCB32]|uniref:phosphatase PAP2 family protein n=1 Tax=Pseudomonas sp. SCB32 TaxID=2653853 RepID=UPI0015B5A34F|nr:phosphatase PAP2 family protein [Pseudomonas sp. SCB32]
MTLYDVDSALTLMLNSAAGKHPLLDQLMLMASTVGVPLMVLAVALQWWRRDDRRNIRHTSLATGFAFLLALAINQLILLFFQRVRPYDAGITHLLIAPSSDPSFPSDHATAAIAIVASLLIQGRRKLGAVLLAVALLVSISRVYLGTHYVSDLIGGALSGIVAAVLVRGLYRRDTRLDQFLTSLL